MWQRSPIVVAGDTFAKVVGLNKAVTRVREIVTRELPVYLVEVIAHEDCTTDDTGTGCGLHNHIDSAEEEVEIRPDVWGITLLSKSEFGAMTAVGDSLIVCLNPVCWCGGLLGEVNEVGAVG